MNGLEKFHNLGKEKQERILHAALLEFAENGYDKASTNKIVQRAGIGKGMLFYYFNSKKELYEYLIQYCFEIAEKEYLNRIDDSKGDILNHLKEISRIKFEFFHQYPEVTKFLSTYVLIDGVSEEMNERFAALKEKAYKKMHLSTERNLHLFRKDIDGKKAHDLIQWMIKGYEASYLEKFKGKKLSKEQIEQMFDEFDEYLDIMRKIFYEKKEG